MFSLRVKFVYFRHNIEMFFVDMNIMYVPCVRTYFTGCIYCKEYSIVWMCVYTRLFIHNIIFVWRSLLSYFVMFIEHKTISKELLVMYAKLLKRIFLQQKSHWSLVKCLIMNAKCQLHKVKLFFAKKNCYNVDKKSNQKKFAANLKYLDVHIQWIIGYQFNQSRVETFITQFLFIWNIYDTDRSGYEKWNCNVVEINNHSDVDVFFCLFRNETAP